MTETRPLWSGLDRALQPLENVAALIGAVMVIAAMLLVSADAFMRYTFNAPLAISYTLTESYLMVGLVCMPLAWGFRTGGYIRIEGLLNSLSPTPRAMLVRAGLLVSSAYMAVLAWTAGKHFVSSHRSSEIMYGVIDWPVSWSWIWVPIGTGLLTLRLLLAAFGPSSDLEANPHAGEGVE